MLGERRWNWGKGALRMMPDTHLTARQEEVFLLLADGKCRKEIAVKLNIEVSTVDFHLAALHRKFATQTAWELISCSVLYKLQLAGEIRFVRDPKA